MALYVLNRKERIEKSLQQICYVLRPLSYTERNVKCIQQNICSVECIGEILGKSVQ